MAKSFVGGTVDAIEAQKFRVNAQAYYDNNQSLALEMAIRCFNKYIESGIIPNLKTDITETLVLKKS